MSSMCGKGLSGLLLTCVLALTGCVSIPDTLQGSSPQPQQDLLRVMSNPSLFVGQESRFGGKVVNVTNLNGKPGLRLLHSRWMIAPDHVWVRPRSVGFMPISEVLLIRWMSEISM